ncbi:MAG: hypothetical protein QOE51_2967 [Actinoplanes sp.]|nr:hypothetical protein [Actinoplanes sp.]
MWPQWRIVAIVVAVACCSASTPVQPPKPVVHPIWTACPTTSSTGPYLQEARLGGSAAQLPRIGDDFQPVAVIVCDERMQKRPDGGEDLVSTQYEGTDIAELMTALRLPDLPEKDECGADLPSPKWLALRDAQGRWVRPGTPTDGCACYHGHPGFGANACANARQEVLDAVRRLTLTAVRSHPVRELRSARAAAAGCPQITNDRAGDFSDSEITDQFVQQPASLTFSGPVRFCVYRIPPHQSAEWGDTGHFVRGGVLSEQRRAALQRLLRAPRAGARCAIGSTQFVWLTNAENQNLDGQARVQLDGCRQLLIDARTGQIMLARADPALIALLSAA